MPILEDIRDPPILSTAEPDPGSMTDRLSAWKQQQDTDGAQLDGLQEASRRNVWYNSSFNSHELALADAASDRIRVLKQATGQELENPFSGGYEIEARARYRDELGHFPDGTNAEDRRTMLQKRMAVFDDKMQALKQQYKIPDAGVSLDTQAKLLANQAIDDSTREWQNAKGTVLPLMATIVGSLQGSIRDPIQVAGLLATGGAVKATTTLGAIAENAIRQGGLNAGLALVSQPAVQKWRADRGVESGVVPAATDVGMAFLFGNAFGAAGQTLAASLGRAGGRASGVTAETLQKAISGDPEAAAIVARHLPDEQGTVLRAAIASEAADRRGMPKPPPGVAPEQAAQTFREALRHAEDPTNNPPPEPLVIARPEQFSLFADAQNPGAPLQYMGKPVGAGRFDPLTIGTDAEAFQYKGGADHAGVTDRLKYVDKWDNLASGKAIVYERAGGELVIADGHQRLGLAKRLRQEQPDADIAMDAYKFSEKDGWTPQDVRAIAARKNIQEGSGDAIDTARVLRERPDLWDASLPVTDPKIKQARGLARLSDEAWGMVLNDVVPANWAQHVGVMADNQAIHGALMQDLVRFAPANEAEARIVIGEAISAGVAHETQMNLFGAMESQRTLMRERIKTMVAAQKMLGEDARVFGILVKEAKRIERAGNVLIDQNAGKADQARVLGEIVDRLARRAGPVSDALSEAARVLQQNPRDVQGPARRFVEQVTQLIEREGLDGLDRPRFFDAPARPVEAPTGPEAKAQIEALQPAKETAVNPVAGNDTVAASDTVANWQKSSPWQDLDAMLASAPANQEKLASVASAIAEQQGLKWIDPGIKTDIGRIRAKQRGKPAGTVKDVIRGAFETPTPEQADAAVAELARHFEVADEGWVMTGDGYFDRKAYVKFTDGSIGEVQFWPSELAQARKEGHALYERARALAKDDPARGPLTQQMVDLYAASFARLPDDFKSVFGSGGSSPNRELNVASSTGRPSMKNSSGSISDHLPPSNIQPLLPSLTAGAPSKTMNDLPGIGTSTSKIGLDTAKVNTAAEPPPRTAAELLQAGAKAEGDIFDLTPHVDEFARPGVLTADGAAAMGEREIRSADIVKVCQT